MASEKKTCRVCGKEYEPCRTASRNPKVFHWQEVACSPECGATYLQRIVESRKPATPSKRNKPKRAAQQAETANVVSEPFMATAEEETAGAAQDAPADCE